MGFKMKGSPAKLGTIQGTSGHKTAVKWNGEIYDRKDGHIFYNDKWLPEGSKDFQWEKMPWE